MKLLRVIATVDPATGGPVAGLRAVTPELASLGHETEFLTVDSPTEPFLESWVGRVHALGPVHNRYARSPRLRAWLDKNLARYDAVVVHGLWQDFGRTVRAACLQRGNPPYFVFPHGMLDPGLRKTYPLRHAKKWLYWQLFERQVLRDARAVLFTCEEERRLARLSFPRYRCTEEVITYGAGVPDAGDRAYAPAWQARCPSATGRPFWLFLGRVHSKKGVDLLLQAYAQVRHATAESELKTFPDLVIAGPCLDESYLAALKKIAGDEAVTPFVHWAGMLTGDAKWGALQSAEAFILPSHQENFGIAVVEALAWGKPVLISDRVNIWRELVADGAALVEPDDAAGVARLLQRWQALPTAVRGAMAAAAVQSFKKRFEISHAAETFAAQLAGLLNQAKPAIP
jgi:glycosyltransferase involved in cell wall biosynthesis